MQDGYITALAALGGSVVGSVTSLATTWLSQHGQRRIERASREASKREALYGQFIDEAARLYAIVLRSESDDPAFLVALLAANHRMRLFSSPPVLEAADAVVRSIIALNAMPNLTLREIAESEAATMTEPLRAFGERCRAELDAIG